MNEGSHDVACAGSSNSPVSRDLAEVADFEPDARIGLCLDGHERLPVLGIGDVFEKVDRRVDGPDNSVGLRPLDPAAHRQSFHHAPRSASSHSRSAARSEISPRSISCSADWSPNAEFGFRIQAYPRPGSLKR